MEKRPVRDSGHPYLRHAHATSAGSSQAKRLKSRTIGSILITTSALEAGKHVGFEQLASVIDNLARLR